MSSRTPPRCGGTIRTTDPDNKTGAFIRQRMTEISEGVAKAFRCTAEVEFSDYCPCMMVDKALAQDAMTYMTDLLGKGAMDMAPLTGGKPGGGSEDFAFVSHEVPTVSMFLPAAARSGATATASTTPKSGLMTASSGRAARRTATLHCAGWRDTGKPKNRKCEKEEHPC